MKKVKVDQSLCIGCGFCMTQASDVFKSNSQGLSEAKVETVSDENKDVVIAMEGCPTGAISIEDDENCKCENCECDHCDCHHE